MEILFVYSILLEDCSDLDHSYIGLKNGYLYRLGSKGGWEYIAEEELSDDEIERLRSLERVRSFQLVARS